MGKVQVLDKHTAELIAAGEVVERPSSIVKELVENSIDAGAHAITVEIRSGGVKYIRITDDGEGIAHDDVPTAFLRHATSKIRSESDLGSIATLGFRGEALASIAAVSRVELVTRTRDEEFGTNYVIEGGEQKEYDECGCPLGTTIIIRDIFYNTPARMKFLKKDAAEGNAISGLLDRMALSHPEISLRFIREGKQALMTSGDGKLRTAVYSVYGKEFADGLMPVDYSLNNVKVSGFTSKPVQSRPNTTMQTFFINGRYCRSRTMQTALEEAYKGSIMIGKHPACILYVTVDCSAVDVNVHPAKMEVRFTNERPVYEAVYYAVKSALRTEDERSRITLPSDTGPVRPGPGFDKLVAPPRKPAPVQPYIGGSAAGYEADRPSAATVPAAPPAAHYGYNTAGGKGDLFAAPPKDSAGAPAAASHNAVTLNDPGASGLSGALSEYSTPFVMGKAPAASSQQADTAFPPGNKAAESSGAVAAGPAAVRDDPFSLSSYRIVGELFRTYIILESGDSMILIDKHAAHERLIYEKLARSGSGREPQLLLEPVSLTLDKQEYLRVLENRDLLLRAGFDVEDFGSGTVLIRSLPAVMTGCDPSEAVMEIASKLGSRQNAAASDRLDDMFHTMACRAAIKGHDVNSPQELAALVAQLMADPEVRYCPHGRPIYIELTKRELEKSFGRIQ